MFLHTVRQTERATKLKVALFLAVFGNLTLYGVPTLVEIALLPYAGITVTFFLLGDLFGLLAFLSLGFVREGILVYALAATTKIAVQLLKLPPHSDIWVADIVPSIAWTILAFIRTDELSQAIMRRLDTGH